MSEWIKLDILNRDDLRGHSSKGNQLKAKDGIYWYKADCMGYEGLTETVVSSLLSRSDILAAVDYEPMKMEYKSHVYTGCRSFLMEGESLITVEKLIRLYTGTSAARTMASMTDVKERICYLANAIAEITGMTDFGKYLTAMLEIDAFFLNEDRHTNNIGVVYHPETRRFRHCPYFDHGLALLADTMTDFPLGEDLEKCIAKMFRSYFFSFTAFSTISNGAGPVSSTALWKRFWEKSSPHSFTAVFFSSRNSTYPI